MVTGPWTAQELQAQPHDLAVARFGLQEAVDLGLLLSTLATARDHAVTIEVRHGMRCAFRAALPGTSEENDEWLRRKFAVVQRFEQSTLAMRVRYEERGTTFTEATGLPEAEFAAHGGGWPVLVPAVGMVGMVGVSGLPQVEDHALILEALAEFPRT